MKVLLVARCVGICGPVSSIASEIQVNIGIVVWFMLNDYSISESIDSKNKLIVKTCYNR